MAKRKTVLVPEPKRERYVSNLKVPLTPEEVADRADRAAQLLQDRDTKEEESKAAAKHAKGVIEAIEAEMRKFSHEVRTRSTYRVIECEREFNYEDGKMRERRLDTDEVLFERELTLQERQPELPFDSEKNGVEANGHA